jgi:hypothetical protein
VSKADAKQIRDKSLRDRDGCDAAMALQLGAEESLVGVVRSVTMTDYYLQIQITDARTAKVLNQQSANFAGDRWASGVAALIRHQILLQ